MNFFIFFILFVFCVALLYILTIPIGILIKRFLLVRKQKKTGRFIHWNDLLVKIKNGEGTLIIIPHGEKEGVWWVPLGIEVNSDYLVQTEEAFLSNCHTRFHTLKSVNAFHDQYPQMKIVYARPVIMPPISTAKSVAPDEGYKG